MNSIISDTEVKFTDGYQLFYFYGINMPFHKRISNVLENQEIRYTDMEFLSVDVYQKNLKTLIKRFNLTEVPTFIIFFNGKEKKRTKGILLASALKSFIYNVVEK